MSKSGISSWMISPKSFVSLLGAEYHLMRDAGVLRRFYMSSVLIVIILIITWISISYAFELLFNTVAFEIALAVFFSLLFFCTYIFLLNTFAKENRVQKGVLNASNIIRTGFVVFMAFLIAQPLIILIYAAKLSPAVEQYKKEVFSNHSKKVDALMVDELEALKSRERYYLTQKKLFGTSSYDHELNNIADKLKAIQNNAANLNQTAQQVIAQSSFFLYRVEKANRSYPVSWIIALVTVLLFLSPGYLIYTISSKHEYYRLKKAQEKELITRAYNAFTERYQKMFDGQIVIFSRYADPPFNTVRKQRPIPASMTDFLKKYLPEG